MTVHNGMTYVILDVTVVDYVSHRDGMSDFFDQWNCQYNKPHMFLTQRPVF